MMQDYQQELILIKNLLKQNREGMSVTGIAKALKKNKNTIGRYLDILQISGHVAIQTYGMAKIYSLSQRVSLSAVISYSKDLIMVLDNESRIIDINDAFLTFLHRTRKEAMGKKINYLTSPAVDVHELINFLADNPIKETERILSFQVKETGERIFRQKYISTVFDDGARGFTIILSDVTEEFLREREIREWEERFRIMADNIQDALLILENEECTFVNRRFVEITGYTVEELRAMDPFAIIAPEDRNVKKQILELWKKRAHEGLAEFQVLIQRKDGVYRHIYVRITGLRYENILYHFIIMTDVTELKLKDAALFESEQRFLWMAENIQDGLVIIENEQYVFASRRFSEITGYTREELRSMNTYDLTTPEERQMMDKLYKRSQTCTEPPAKFQIWIRRKNGERQCLFGHINSVRQGNTTSTYVTITDVTAFAQREEELLGKIVTLEKVSRE